MAGRAGILLLAGAVLLVAGIPELVGESLRVCLVSGSREYQSERSLLKLEGWLKERHGEGVECERLFGEDKGKNLPNAGALRGCDLMVLFSRRLTLPEEEMVLVRSYVEEGNPIVGIRTASHAFQNWEPEWEAFDREVLGGHYSGHYGRERAEVRVVSGAEGHPILEGVEGFVTHGKLYKNPELAEGAQVLLEAETEQHREPVAWTHEYEGARIFYTSLGVPEDFENEEFKELLLNAVAWGVGLEE